MRHPPAKSGFTLRRGAAQADFFEYSPDFGHRKRTVNPSFLFCKLHTTAQK